MTGYIYILTPSFPQYVKIGYATDVKQRLAELNRSTAMPFAFRVYATYEVDSALLDKKLHSILDKLNPDLRSTEEVDGKRRIREFYTITPEDAYSILEAIAEIIGACYTGRSRFLIGIPALAILAQKVRRRTWGAVVGIGSIKRFAVFRFAICYTKRRTWFDPAVGILASPPGVGSAAVSFQNIRRCVL